MDKINRFIDTCLIDEYAIKGRKDKKFNYSLDVDAIPIFEIHNLIELLMEEDGDVREYVLIAIQKLINERLREVELKDRANAGYKSRRDRINGEVIIFPGHAL